MNIYNTQSNVRVHRNLESVDEFFNDNSRYFDDHYRRKYQAPKKFQLTNPIKIDNEQYQFSAFHQVQNMKSAHYQSKYTLSMGGVPNLLIHSFHNSLTFYDISKQQSYTSSLPLEAIGLDAQDNQLAIAGMGGDLLIVNMYDSRTELHKINLNRDFINHVTFFEQYLIINDNAGALKIFDLNSGFKLIYEYKDKRSINLTSANKDHLIAFCGDKLGTFVLDVKTNDMVHELYPHSEFGFAVAFNPIKQYELASSSEDGSAVIYDLRSPKQPLQQFVGAGEPIYNITYTKSGTHLLIAEAKNNFHILNTDLYDKVQSLQVKGDISGIASDTYDPNKFYFSVNYKQRDGIYEYRMI